MQTRSTGKKTSRPLTEAELARIRGTSWKPAAAARAPLKRSKAPAVSKPAARHHTPKPRVSNRGPPPPVPERDDDKGPPPPVPERDDDKGPPPPVPERDDEELLASELRAELAHARSAPEDDPDPIYEYERAHGGDYADLDIAMPVAMTPMRNTLPVMEDGFDIDMGIPTTQILASEGTGALGLQASAIDGDVRAVMHRRRRAIEGDDDWYAPATTPAHEFRAERMARLQGLAAAGEDVPLEDLLEEPTGDRPDEGYEHLGAASIPPAFKKSYNWDE